MLRSLMLAGLFGSSLAVLPSTLAQEEKKPDMKKEGEKKEEPEKKAAPATEKAPDWSKFAHHLDVTGEIFKVSDTTITIRTQVPQRVGKQTKMNNVDTDYTWNEMGLARREKAPQFTDDKGKPRQATQKELDALKKPEGVKGYAMDKGELKPGDIVKLAMVRPTSTPKAKVQPSDLTIQYAFLVGEKTSPKK